MAVAYWLIAARLWRGLQHVTNSIRLESLNVAVNDSPSAAHQLPTAGEITFAGIILNQSCCRAIIFYLKTEKFDLKTNLNNRM